MAQRKQLRFRVDPHIVEDLGVNLYTTLPRVLVEFLANAYDADSPAARILIDVNAIQKARHVVRQEYKLEFAKATPTEQAKLELLERRTLPDDLRIVIEDDGLGMSLDDLQEKYLVIGRRRRDHGSVTTPAGRAVMGRKGLGKLAAFGVAHVVEIVSRKKGAKHASRIVLDYDTIRKMTKAEDVPVNADTLANGGGIKSHGTRITLSKLVFESVSSEEDTIRSVVGSTFSMIDTQDFVVELNGVEVDPPKRKFVFAYPSPTIGVNKLINEKVTTEEGQILRFEYRIRFTGKGKQLDTHERGMRVYAHGRLAAMPDLLGLRTGMHGYQNTHYLDGKVVADFIDDQTIDYIATDRQSLRWETPLLLPLRDFLKAEMEKAIVAYQKYRDEQAADEVKEDAFTKKIIEGARLPKHRKRSAYKIAASIASGKGDSTQDTFYRKALPILVRGLGQGEILATIASLMSEGTQDLHKVVAVLTRLTAQEFDDFVTVMQGRIDGIKVLESLYKKVDFNDAKNEDELHALFKRNPWLIDPTFTQFLTSNTTENELNLRLAKELEIDEHLPSDYNKTAPDEVKPLGTNKRPDLVFLLSSASLRRLVIIELKAPNTPLHSDHLTQLEGYMQRAEEWLASQKGEKAEYKVEGYLIGSMAKPDMKGEKVKHLKYRMDKEMDKAAWSVFDIGEVLERTKRAHDEILKVYDRAAKAADDEEKHELGN